MNKRGSALIATLILMIILMPLGAYVVLQCRTDLVIERNFRAELESFYAAEAGLEHAVAEIGPGQSFEDILAGPDGIGGTSDDGVFPFREGLPGAFPYSPITYDVRVTAVGDSLLSLVSRGTGRVGASKIVAALVRRSPLVFTPAALYAAAAVARADFGDGRFLLSGLDHLSTDTPAQPAGAAPALPALASPDAGAEADLRQRLDDALARQLVGAGGVPSLTTTPAIDLAAAVTHVATQPACTRLGAVDVSQSAILGTPRTPQLSVVDGDITVAGALSGNGVLIVNGALHVGGSFEFTGLVIAMSDIAFEPGSSVTVAGALWSAGDGDSRLQLRGAGAVVYSSRALDAVDAAFPAVLPHAAVIAGWEEQL